MAETRAVTIPAERPALSPVCAFCARLDDAALADCEAFDEIPVPIWSGDNDHTRPYAGDGGLRFELVGADEQKEASEFSEEDDLDVPDPYDDDLAAEIERQLKELEGEVDGKASLAERVAYVFAATGRNKINLDKLLTASQANAQRRLGDLAERFREGKIDYPTWARQAKTEIQANTLRAHQIGLAQARGVYPPTKLKLSGGERKAATKMAEEQLKYFSKFRADVRKQLAEGKALTTALDARARMYAGAAKAVASEAIITAEPKQKLRWIRHKDDSCETCLDNEGAEFTAAEWHELGVWPAHGTRCLTNCGCSLDPVA